MLTAAKPAEYLQKHGCVENIFGSTARMITPEAFKVAFEGRSVCCLDRWHAGFQGRILTSEGLITNCLAWQEDASGSCAKASLLLERLVAAEGSSLREAAANGKEGGLARWQSAALDCAAQKQLAGLVVESNNISAGQVCLFLASSFPSSYPCMQECRGQVFKSEIFGSKGGPTVAG